MVMVPTPVMVAVCPAVKEPVSPATVKEETVSELSTSESLERTLPVALEPSATVLESSVRRLGSSTGLMLMLRVD